MAPLLLDLLVNSAAPGVGQWSHSQALVPLLAEEKKLQSFHQCVAGVVNVREF